MPLPPPPPPPPVCTDPDHESTTTENRPGSRAKQPVATVTTTLSPERNAQMMMAVAEKTSFIRAVLPSLTQDWKKLGATETPSASLVMPVSARSELLAITRNVPNSSTSKR
uniref:Uncharacterized protein n=1 Tax=Anopheles melas TaxID=34690 RepID=A0A182TQU8_9DIPT